MRLASTLSLDYCGAVSLTLLTIMLSSTDSIYFLMAIVSHFSQYLIWTRFLFWRIGGPEGIVWKTSAGSAPHAKAIIYSVACSLQMSSLVFLIFKERRRHLMSY